MVKGHKQLQSSLTIMAAMSSQDQEKLAQFPGPLKYGLLVEFAQDLAKEWLALYSEIPHFVWDK
ncbi:MAG: hypothetical protein ACK5PF_07520 [bacterium]|jgi:hypothetical protein